MVMVKVAHLTSQHQSLVKAEVTTITPLQEDLSVLTAAKFIKEMFAQQGDLFVLDVTKEDTLRQCVDHPGEPHVLSKKLCKKFKPRRTRTLVTKQKMLT